MNLYPLATAVAVLTVLSSSLPAQGTVRIAGPEGDPTADFAGISAIQQAVSASSDGDVVLVRSGSYGRFSIDARAVSVLADRGAAVVMDDFFGVAVTALAPGQTVVLAGIEIPTSFIAQDERLRVTDCEGAVWIQDCEIATFGGFF